MIREVVPDALAGERVDRVVAFITGCSRAQASGLVAEGAVTCNDIPVRKGSHKVDVDDVVVIDTVTLEVDNSPQPDPTIDLVEIFVDDHVIVVDKPAGLVVHPGSGTPDGTLVNALLARYPQIADVGERDRPGIVHRLDRGTSGVLMVARSEDALQALSAQLRDRTVERQYVALAGGHIEADRGVIDAKLGRSRRHPIRQAVVADGRDARTHYEVVERFGDPIEATLTRCRLETGRTHQIRVHLAAIGHPVVGDDLYGGHLDGLDRPALHAEVLGFTHPASGEWLRFESAVPDDLAALLAGFS